MRNIKLFRLIYLGFFIPLIISLLFSATIAHAQTGSGSAPNVRTYVDSNSVDLLTGERIFSFHLVSIGAGSDGLSANVVSTRRGNYNIDRHEYWGAINEYSGIYIVNIGQGAEDFTKSGSIFTSKSQSGSMLTLSGNTYTYTTADGTVALFDSTITSTAPVKANKAMLTSVTAPNGQKLYLDYDQPTGTTEVYLRSVRNNLGYQIKYTNEEENVMAINNRDEYCSPTDANETCGSGSFTPSKWAMSEFERLPSIPTTSVIRESMDYAETDITRFSDASTASEIVTATNEDFGYTFDSSTGRVTSVDVNGALWSYSYSDSGGQRTTTITQPLGGSRVVVSDIAKKVVLTDTDAMNRSAAYTYDSYNRLKSSTTPSGVRTEYDYDGRGNVTETRVIATNNATLTTKVGYAATCTNPKTCNKPLWTEDTKGKRTDYTYNSTHGGIVSITGPAATAGAVRPKVRYYYQNYKAKIKNSAGNLVATTDGIWKLKIVRACPNASTCTGSTDERVITRNYNTWQNNFPYYSRVSSGDNSIVQLTTSGTDIYGNVTYVDGPLTGNVDRTSFFYDVKEQRRIGTIGPDPDGAGSLKRQAVRFEYSATGQMTATKSGYTTYASLYYLNAMTVKQSAAYEYDAYGRRTRTSVLDGAVIKAVTQTGYDAQGRVQCQAQRMDKDDLSAMPTACVMDNPSDRITKVSYNLAGQLWNQWNAYGSPDQTRVINTYWANGNLRHIRDQEGRYTRYYYDEFNRHYKTYYPRKDGSATQSTDYTRKFFDQYGRQRAARLRDGKEFYFTRDDLGRIYHVNTTGTDDDRSYGFDLFGRVTSSAKGGVTTSQTWDVITNSYDALSRLKSEGNEFGTTSYDYDVAGRMTKLTYPGTGFYVNYDYNTRGQVTKIRENGASSGTGVLAQYTYDDLGRRTAVIRGNGNITTYDHNELSRLTDMTHDVAGTAFDLTFAYEYNPAGQITRQERSSTAYDWDIDNLEANSFINNGLNQAVSMNNGTTTSAITYDNRGNLTAHSGKTYGYDIFNKLTSVSGTSAQSGTVLDVTLEYDVKGRLKKEIDNNSETRFAYSGSQLIAEYNQYNTPTARYVHGPGSDEPIVMYNDPMNISGQQETLWMISDTRGSIIGYTNASGAVTNINTYSPEGVPGDNNVGRFGFTGQMWLEGAELYHYKARAYDPQLSRFLQADPIGYGDGLNMYAYAGGDAINNRDPSGLASCTTTTEYRDTTTFYENGDVKVEREILSVSTQCDTLNFFGGSGGGNQSNNGINNFLNALFGSSAPGVDRNRAEEDAIKVIKQLPCPAVGLIPAPAEGSNSIGASLSPGSLGGSVSSSIRGYANADGTRGYGFSQSLEATTNVSTGSVGAFVQLGGAHIDPGNYISPYASGTAGPVSASVDLQTGDLTFGASLGGPGLTPGGISVGLESGTNVQC